MNLNSYILQQEDGRQANNIQQKSGLLDIDNGIMYRSRLMMGHSFSATHHLNLSVRGNGELVE
jgi:hypothetical protein